MGLSFKIEKNLFPLRGRIVFVSFHFRLAFEKFIKPLYKQFFQKDLEYTKCKEFEIKKEDKFRYARHPGEKTVDIIVPAPLKKVKFLNMAL